MFTERDVPRLRKELYIKITFYFQCLKFTQSKSKHMLQVTIHSIHLEKNIWDEELRLTHFNMCCVD